MAKQKNQDNAATYSNWKNYLDIKKYTESVNKIKKNIQLSSIDKITEIARITSSKMSLLGSLNENFKQQLNELHQEHSELNFNNKKYQTKLQSLYKERQKAMEELKPQIDVFQKHYGKYNKIVYDENVVEEQKEDSSIPLDDNEKLENVTQAPPEQEKSFKSSDNNITRYHDSDFKNILTKYENEKSLNYNKIITPEIVDTIHTLNKTKSILDKINLREKKLNLLEKILQESKESSKNKTLHEQFNELGEKDEQLPAGVDEGYLLNQKIKLHREINKLVKVYKAFDYELLNESLNLTDEQQKFFANQPYYTLDLDGNPQLSEVLAGKVPKAHITELKNDLAAQEKNFKDNPEAALLNIYENIHNLQNNEEYKKAKAENPEFSIKDAEKLRTAIIFKDDSNQLENNTKDNKYGPTQIKKINELKLDGLKIDSAKVMVGMKDMSSKDIERFLTGLGREELANQRLPADKLEKKFPDISKQVGAAKLNDLVEGKKNIGQIIKDKYEDHLNAMGSKSSKNLKEFTNLKIVDEQIKYNQAERSLKECEFISDQSLQEVKSIVQGFKLVFNKTNRKEHYDEKINGIKAQINKISETIDKLSDLKKNTNGKEEVKYAKLLGNYESLRKVLIDQEKIYTEAGKIAKKETSFDQSINDKQNRIKSPLLKLTLNNGLEGFRKVVNTARIALSDVNSKITALNVNHKATKIGIKHIKTQVGALNSILLIDHDKLLIEVIDKFQSITKLGDKIVGKLNTEKVRKFMKGFEVFTTNVNYLKNELDVAKADVKELSAFILDGNNSSKEYTMREADQTKNILNQDKREVIGQAYARISNAIKSSQTLLNKEGVPNTEDITKAIKENIKLCNEIKTRMGMSKEHNYGTSLEQLKDIKSLLNNAKELNYKLDNNSSSDKNKKFEAIIEKLDKTIEKAEKNQKLSHKKAKKEIKNIEKEDGFAYDIGNLSPEAGGGKQQGASMGK